MNAALARSINSSLAHAVLAHHGALALGDVGLEARGLGPHRGGEEDAPLAGRVDADVEVESSDFGFLGAQSGHQADQVGGRGVGLRKPAHLVQLA